MGNYILISSCLKLENQFITATIPMSSSSIVMMNLDAGGVKSECNDHLHHWWLL